ncbi:MAG: glycosyltransferase [Pelagibacteraceae bacterium]|jgi:glycosyltransferase involved in cell wall biosynthesis|nr:glycosyltransferase [Pelagibacteraceae bacterium]
MSETIHILIPTFNRVNLIKETIDSVINQSYKFWILTIIDNSSSDNTVQMLKKNYHNLIIQKKIIIKTHDKFVIPTINWNRCIKYIGEYKYFKLLGSDDLLDKNFLLTAINSLKETNDSIAGFTSGVRYIDNKNNRIGQRTYGFFGLELLISIFYRNYVGVPSSQVLKSKFFRKSKFCNIPYAGDVLFIITYCFAKKKKLIFSKKLLVDFRVWTESDSVKTYGSTHMIEGRFKCRNNMIKIIYKKSYYIFFLLLMSKIIRLVEYSYFFWITKLKIYFKIW